MEKPTPDGDSHIDEFGPLPQLNFQQQQYALGLIKELKCRRTEVESLPNLDHVSDIELYKWSKNIPPPHAVICSMIILPGWKSGTNEYNNLYHLGMIPSMAYHIRRITHLMEQISDMEDLISKFISKCLAENKNYVKHMPPC